MSRTRTKAAALAVAGCTALTVGLAIAPEAQAAGDVCVLKNDATAARGINTTIRLDERHDNYYLGTIYVQSGTTSPGVPCGTNDSTWNIAAHRKCTWHPAGGTSRTYTGPISLFLTDDTIVDRCVYV